VTRIIFLDIDGPMIPATMYLADRMCSSNRNFPPTTIGVINYLCKKSDAQIVFNTTHNIDAPGDIPIQQAIINGGLKQEYIHVDSKTIFPSKPRGEAIIEWLLRHPEVTDWIALDDDRFTGDERLIWVDPYPGVHIEHLNIALERWQLPPILLLM
jgi:hypothetical protein